MGKPTIEQDKDKFISLLGRSGGSMGNMNLRGKLGWAEERYWRVHGKLSDAGLIMVGRGKGGSVTLAKLAFDGGAEVLPGDEERSASVVIAEDLVVSQVEHCLKILPILEEKESFMSRQRMS